MNAAILITARLKSTRLPRKVVKPILGRPMICHMIDRLKLARLPQEIILCTSTLPEDDELTQIAGEESISCFRGDPDDVLARLTAAAEQFGWETVFSCTADNPFVDAVYLDQLLEYHRAQGYDYTKSEGLPLGVFGYALSLPAMQRACKLKVEIDTEIWGPLFADSGKFACGIMKITDPEFYWPDLRLTVDTAEDFLLITRIFETLYEPGSVFSLASILDLCRRDPSLPAINAGIQQRAGKQFTLKPNADEARA
jgi:spore coat polysaccharide biosynthesis protein SpsF